MPVSSGMQWFRSHLDSIVFGSTTLAVVFPVISIAVSQTFLGLAILGFLLDRLLNRRTILRFPPVKLPLLLFIGATLVSWLASPEPGIGLPPIYKFWLFAIILLVANYFSRTRVGRAFQALFAAGLVAAGFALAQYLVPSLGSVDGRLTGFMGHWMTLSGGLMLVFLAMLGTLLFSAPRRPALWMVAVCFLGVTLLLTLTRSVWIASLACLLVAAWLRFPTLKTVLVSGAGILILVVCLPDSLQKRLASIWDPAHPSNAARLEIWKTGMQMVQAHPWFGVGPQRVSEVFFDYHPDPGARQRGGFFWIHMHNNLLQFAAERGIPCALAWLWLILRMGRDHWLGFRRARLPSLEKSVHAGGFLSLLALFVAGLFEFNFGDSEVLMVFLFLVSAPYALVPTAGSAPRDPEPAGAV
ncbi:MAG: O-antigen ligase family protein [Acidobacteriota bacterium]|nr:O-antigen ligase family protein [Acidobacteriota bacterium]